LRWFRSRTEESRLAKSAFLILVLVVAGCGATAGSEEAATSDPAGLIAFARQDSSGRDRIYVVEPNGHGLHALTSARLNAYEPVWSPDGKQIAYIAGDYERLYLMNSDGSHKHLISEGAGPLGGATRPTWSPDGKRLLFSVQTFDGKELYVVDMDGRHLHRLSKVDSDSPAWSPRGDLIAVTLRHSRIAELDAHDGKEVRILTRPGFCAEWPTWSRDGERIAYVAYGVSRGSCGDASSSSIREVNVDGSDDKPLDHQVPGTWDDSPAWSPNGDEIAYQCGDNPFFGAICVLEPGDPPSIRFVAGNALSRNFDPSWQPVPG
jgi:Tol biopolymer transport system component